MTEFINCTPHEINVNGTVFPASGNIARVSSNHESIDSADEFEYFDVSYGDITGLPEPYFGVCYIVSFLVLDAAKKSDRFDCIAPATGHPDVVRNEKGHILSVPGFIV